MGLSETITLLTIILFTTKYKQDVRISSIKNEQALHMSPQALYSTVHLFCWLIGSIKRFFKEFLVCETKLF